MIRTTNLPAHVADAIRREAARLYPECGTLQGSFRRGAACGYEGAETAPALSPFGVAFKLGVEYGEDLRPAVAA